MPSLYNNNQAENVIFWRNQKKKSRKYSQKNVYIKIMYNCFRACVCVYVFMFV